MGPVKGKVFLLVMLKCIIPCGVAFFYTNVKKMFDGEILPADPDVCTTQNITFTAVLKDDPLSNHSIGFTYKTRHTLGEYVTVDRNKVNNVNETMAQYTVTNIPPFSDVDKPFYLYVNSYYWHKFGNRNETLQLGKTTSARIYPMPEKVRDFFCVVRNYEDMLCSWKYGQEYGIHMPDVVFEWRNPFYSASWTECRYLNKKDGFCTWNESKAGFFDNSNITIRLTLKQKCDVNVTSMFYVDTSKIETEPAILPERFFKPNPVSVIRSNVINSTCVTLLWRTTDSGLHYPKEHLITVSSSGVPFLNSTLLTTMETERLEHKQTFCDILPYTKVTFNVRIRPIGDYSGYFSDSVQHTSQTYSDIPSASPLVTEGGYSCNHRECDGSSGKKRRVCLFWKPIKAEDKNGPMRGLEGVFTPLQPTKQIQQEDWAEDVMYGCSNILCNSSYVFTIKARNINGTSKRGSTLIIPALTSVISPPEFIVESTNSFDVYVSWSYSGQNIPNSFLVTWCRNEHGDCRPRHNVGWKIVNATSTATILPIDTPQDYLYGVGAITDNDDSTGVEWKDCVYLKHALPKRRPENVAVSIGSEDNSLVVTWDKLSCTSNEPFIAMYNIQYNKVNDVKRTSINVSESEKARLVLQNLNEDQAYAITIRGVTRNGIYGPESGPYIGVPVKKSLKLSEIVAISFSVLICVIFAGIGLICAVRRCKKKAQETIRQARNITIPECPDQENISSLLRQYSKDSGYEKTPPLVKKNNKFELRNPMINLPFDFQYLTACTNESDCSISAKPETESVTSEHEHIKQKDTPMSIPLTSKYLCNQDTCLGDSSKDRKFDREEFSKHLSSLIDNNQNIFAWTSKDILRENQVKPSCNNDIQFDEATLKSSPYITQTNHHIPNILVPNDACKQSDDEHVHIDTSNSPNYSQQYSANIFSYNFKTTNLHADDTQSTDAHSLTSSGTREEQVCVKQTQLITDNADSEITFPQSVETVASPKLDMTSLSLLMNQTPETIPDFSSNATSSDTLKTVEISEYKKESYSPQVDQRKDQYSVAHLSSLDIHLQLYKFEQNKSLDDEINSHDQNQTLTLSNGYIPHSLKYI